MAAGDILSVTIGDEGWFIDVVVEGFTTGATYDFGLVGGTPTALTPYLTVVSEGYDAAGVLGTISRKVYLTLPLRQAYPAQASLQESASGGNLTVRVSLAEFVYDDDRAGGAGTSGTDPVLTAPVGWITSGGVKSNPATVTAVNSSTLPYPKVIASWARPDRERLTTAEVKLSAVAFHQHPRNRRPVAAVKFAATNGTQNATQIITAPQVDGTYADATPVVEYLGTVPLTGFADDTLVTCDFTAYPWVGDENSVATTTAAVDADEYTGKLPRQYYVLDTDGSRGYPIVVVSPAGNDALLYTDAVKASDTQGNRDAAALTPVATLGRAMRLLYDHNNAVNGRANPQGGTIYITGGGTLEVMGTIPSTPTTVVGNAWTWTTVKPLPGGAAPTLIPDATGGDRAQVAKGVKWSGCTFERSADAYWLRTGGTATFRTLAIDCTFRDTRASNTYGSLMVDVGAPWFVRCAFEKVIAAGNTRPRYRGCSAAAGYSFGQLLLHIGGNFTHDATPPPGNVFANPSSQANDAEGAILAFSRFYKLSRQLGAWFQLAGVAYTQGAAIVQNLVELLDTTGAPAVFMSGDGTTSSTRDCIIWHNTVAGQRVNLFYNDSGTAKTPHLGHGARLNAFDYYAHKGDLFNAPTGGQSGGRTGGWAVDNGVLNGGNRNQRGELAFQQRFPGLGSLRGTSQSPLILDFVDDRSFRTTNTGGGDYRPRATSALLEVEAEQMFAYDIAGATRAPVDAAGAYAALDPKAPPRGGFFFG